METDQIINWLRDKADRAPNHSWTRMLNLAADRMLDYKRANEWISVKDRLPENICPVLVALEGLNTAFHGWYQDGKWWTVGAGTRPFQQKVTHWMPMPPAPEDMK